MSELPTSTRAPDLGPTFEPVFDVGFNAYLGSIYRQISADPDVSHRYVFDVGPNHLNGSGFTHGGLLMTVADAVLGSTVARRVGHMCTTISLNCDFISAAQQGERIEGTALITRQTRTVVFVGGELHVEGRTLMTATGIWKTLKNGFNT